MSADLSFKKEFVTPRLIQRLSAPINPGHASAAWGGAVGVLKRNHREALSHIMSIDYMGNSDYELGILSRAMSHFSQLAHRNKIAAIEIPVTVSKNVLGQTVSDTVPVYVLTPVKYADNVRRFLVQNDNWHTSEPTRFQDAILASKLKTQFGNAATREEKVQGWFDLQNQVFFFKDKEMFQQVRAAFHVRDRALPPQLGFKPVVSVGINGPELAV